MSGRDTSLYKYFSPEIYSLEFGQGICNLIIDGQKFGPPSKRICLHQKNLKILSAEIYRLGKNPLQYQVDRINHLPTFEQVRLHTKEIQYPGAYRLSLSYKIQPEMIKKILSLADDKPNRQLLPCVDTPEAWAGAAIVIKS
jgi:hypothetical protein